MSGVVVFGSQWGDEGKGRFVDFLAGDADMVVRYQGAATTQATPSMQTAWNSSCAPSLGHYLRTYKVHHRQRRCHQPEIPAG